MPYVEPKNEAAFRKRQLAAQRAVLELAEIRANFSDDTEMAHSAADRVLCELLIALGLDDVVVAWDEVEKWYA